MPSCAPSADIPPDRAYGILSQGGRNLDWPKKDIPAGGPAYGTLTGLAFTGTVLIDNEWTITSLGAIAESQYGKRKRQPHGLVKLPPFLFSRRREHPMGQSTGRILLILGTGLLAVIGIIQLIRGDYASAGIYLLAGFLGALVFALTRRANKKSRRMHAFLTERKRRRVNGNR